MELVKNKTSLSFFNRLFLVPKPNNKWRPILDLSNLNIFLKAEKFKMETLETIRTSLQQGEWVTSIDFKDAYFHIPIQEQSRKYLRYLTYTRPLAEPSGQSIRNIVTTNLSGPAAHVTYRSANSNRKASSPRPTTYETRTVASQKQLEGTRVTRKGDSNSQIIAPSSRVVAAGGQRSHRPTITPNKTCSANRYRRIKRRVGRSLK